MVARDSRATLNLKLTIPSYYSINFTTLVLKLEERTNYMHVIEGVINACGLLNCNV